MHPPSPALNLHNSTRRCNMAFFVEAPFGAYTSMVVHSFLCSIRVFSHVVPLRVTGNSDGCRWLSDPTSRVQIGEQQPQVETVGDRGVETVGVTTWPWYTKPLMFYDFVRAQNGRGKKSKSKTARISSCFSAWIECWHLERSQDP